MYAAILYSSPTLDFLFCFEPHWLVIYSPAPFSTMLSLASLSEVRRYCEHTDTRRLHTTMLARIQPVCDSRATLFFFLLFLREFTHYRLQNDILAACYCASVGNGQRLTPWSFNMILQQYLVT